MRCSACPAWTLRKLWCLAILSAFINNAFVGLRSITSSEVPFYVSIRPSHRGGIHDVPRSHLSSQRLHVGSKDLLRFVNDAPGDEGDHPADFALNDRNKVRDHFTQAEMDVILSLGTLSLRDALMLRIMSETGLRRRAVSWLLVDCVFDRAARHCLPVGRALEKGLVTRPFCLSQASQKILKEYIENDHPGPHVRWLFPSSKKGNQSPIDPSVVNSVLLKACHTPRARLLRTLTLANIRGRHTHTHAIRHRLFWHPKHPGPEVRCVPTHGTQ